MTENLAVNGQLRPELRRLRPTIWHLNEDTSWLLQIPHPRGLRRRAAGERIFFNILLDPWFAGTQTDIATWFSTQEHSTPSSVKDVQELEEQLRAAEEVARCPGGGGLEAEAVVSAGNTGTRREKTGGADDHGVDARESESRRSGSMIDLVVVSHEFTDHCHRATLTQLRKDVLVIAPTSAAKLIRSWNHFDLEKVVVMPNLTTSSSDWLGTGSGLPVPWLRVLRLTTTLDSFHSGIVLVSQSGEQLPAIGEAIVYSPHGINTKSLEHLSHAKPPIETLALLHGLHDVELGVVKQLNLGARNGLRAQRDCGARYWIGTHDEEKIARGIVARFLRRKRLTVEQVLVLEKEHGDERDASVWNDVSFRNLASGERLVLA